ncbi:hypothetical protein [Corynebacterium freiburgense]|uniref:hypothetical protein n=1 Tax=Corynebacterium freiburgense TaxID=556548 RepID=UPI00047C9BBC|nr:hypothetical protein [Corynebacterium freiburgense]WJZ03509.1 hypothetical protein CFREI_11205 [Corynebacterium freiburgense]
MTSKQYEQPQGDEEPTTYFPPTPPPDLYEGQYAAQGGYYDANSYPNAYSAEQYGVQGYYDQWADPNQSQAYTGDAIDTAAPLAQEPKKQNNGVVVFLVTMVFLLAMFSGGAALYIYSQQHRPQEMAQSTAESASESDDLDESRADNPAEEFGSQLQALDRPKDPNLPPEAVPVNVAAKQNLPAGNLFNVYKSGSTSDQFAVDVQYEYVSTYTEPAAGDHLVLVFDSQQDDYVELHCQDYSSYVKCVAPGNRYVYIA